MAYHINARDDWGADKEKAEPSYASEATPHLLALVCERSNIAFTGPRAFHHPSLQSYGIYINWSLLSCKSTEIAVMLRFRPLRLSIVSSETREMAVSGLRFATKQLHLRFRFGLCTPSPHVRYKHDHHLFSDSLPTAGRKSNPFHSSSFHPFSANAEYPISRHSPNFLLLTTFRSTKWSRRMYEHRRPDAPRGMEHKPCIEA